MGRVIRNDVLTLNSLTSGVSDSNYLTYQKTLIDNKHNSEFMFATNVIAVKKEYPFASGIYDDVIARAERVAVPDKAQFLGDDYRKLLFKNTNETVGVGYKFLIEDENWLCYNTDNIGAVTKSCLVRRCNSSIKWKNKYGQIEEEPCIVDYFKFTFTNNTIEFDKQMRLGGNLRLVVVQANSITNSIVRDMRFIFNDLTWRVTNAEKITHSGLIEITIEEHQISVDTDNLTERIADYYKPTKFSVLINTDKLTLVVGEVNTISYKVLYDGVEIAEPCVLESSDENIITTSGNTVTALAVGTSTIKVSLEENSDIYSELSISVHAVIEDSYIYGVDLTKFGGTYRYTVINPVDDSYLFSCADTSVVITTISSLVCDIKVPNVVKTIVLTATGIDGDVLTKSVDIRSMW